VVREKRRGIHTPLHTRYVRAPPEADGRNPIRGFAVLAPHRCRAAPDSRVFLTANGSRVFPLSQDPSTKARESGPPASELGLPNSGGGLAYEGQTLCVTGRWAVETSAFAVGDKRATLLSRPPLLPCPLGHHTP
jgi:hypothetical protein